MNHGNGKGDDKMNPFLTNQKFLGITILAIGGLLLAGCEQTMRTGRVGNITPNAPNPDGTCPPGLSACGKANFTKCLDLQTDPEHCGTCDNACVPGIACVAGTCQQIACNGPVTLSPEAIATDESTTDRAISGAILADVNGDGRLDLVSWNIFQSGMAKGIYVALGKAGGGFGAPSIYQATTDVKEIVAGDANADGFQDLFITTGIYYSPCVEVWLGHADGKLTPTAKTSVTGCGDYFINGLRNTIVIGDLNGDGRTDVVTTGGIQVFLADSQGVLHGPKVYPEKGPPVFTSEIILQDWNADGMPDLVVMTETLAVYLNKGNGTFNEGLDCVVPSQTMVLADFNRDKYVDIAWVTSTAVGVLLGMGGCQFHTLVEYPVPGSSGTGGSITKGDINGDGFVDLIAQTDEGIVSLLLGKGDGTFQIAPSPLNLKRGGTWTSKIMVAEVTGDGKADIVLIPPPSESSPLILRNTCP
jgi:hypothetical protein